MLPDISLDSERYSDILEDARNMIVSLYPEWTDFNYHDPGITMLELFSWIKETQQYHIDRIGEANLRKYLKLLGVSRKPKIPAKARLCLDSPMDLNVLKGTKFFANNVCFEADENVYIPCGKIEYCVIANNFYEKVFDSKLLNFGGRLNMYPFGKVCEPGDLFYIGLSAPLSPEFPVSVSFEFSDDYPVKRNPVGKDDSFCPLGKINIQYFDGCVWQDANLIEDETLGFIRSGAMKFVPCGEMKKCTINGAESFFVRFVISECHYDVTPVIRDISFSSFVASQTMTLCESFDILSSEIKQNIFLSTSLAASGVSRVYVLEDGAFRLLPLVEKRIDEETGGAVFTSELLASPKSSLVRIVNMTPDFANRNEIGFGTALPCQEIDLNNLNICYEGFELMTQDPENESIYYPWDKVDDFSLSSPEDRHYIFDSAAGIVRFGNSFKGLAPEGRIILTGFRLSLGAGGNVNKNKINRLEAGEIPGLVITNKCDSFGGENEETLEHCFARAQKKLKSPVSAVTYSDYEQRVLQTPGLMVESCRVIPASAYAQGTKRPNDMNIDIVVKTCANQDYSLYNEVYRRNILNHLDKFRTVGTEVTILDPEYIGVSVYADIGVKPHYITARKIIKETVANYFSALRDEFGAEIVYSELYGVIDMLECVSSVNSFSIEVNVNGITANKDGNIKLPANGIVFLQNEEYMISIDD